MLRGPTGLHSTFFILLPLMSVKSWHNITLVKRWPHDTSVLVRRSTLTHGTSLASAQTYRVAFSVSDSGEPCGTRQRRWGRPSPPRPCRTPQDHESTATLGGSSKPGRLSPRRRTSTPSHCSTGAETRSAGWGHALNTCRVASNMMHTMQQICTFLIPQNVTCFVTPPPPPHTHTHTPPALLLSQTPNSVSNFFPFSLSPTPVVCDVCVRVCVCVCVCVCVRNPPTFSGGGADNDLGTSERHTWYFSSVCAWVEL